MDAWTWTLQYLAVSTAKWKPILVPPCPDLPRTVHLVPPPNDGAWSEEAKARMATRMTKRGAAVETHGRTAQKYLESILALKAENPDWTQKQLGDAVGIAQSAVSIILKQGAHATP